VQGTLGIAVVGHPDDRRCSECGKRALFESDAVAEPADPGLDENTSGPVSSRASREGAHLEALPVTIVSRVGPGRWQPR
jgi:hypothetical protein